MSLNLDKKCNRDTSDKASSFLKLVTSFDFMAALVITRNVFDLNLPVTQLLQSKSNHTFDGIHLMEALKHLVVSTKNYIDYYHDLLYDQAISLAEKIKVPEKKASNSRAANSQE